jgi:hypothetical protein
MNEIEERLKTNHAAVFLTLVSVVVALALEDLLSQVRESPVLWQADAAAVRLWIKVFLALQAAFAMWVAYSAFILSLRWILGVWDAVQVFFLAIFLYVFNTVAFFEAGHILLYTAALYALSGSGVLLTNLRRASHYPENQEILRRGAYRSTLWCGVANGGAALVFAILVHTRTAGVIAESAFGVGMIIGLSIWLWFFMQAWRHSVSVTRGPAD